MPLSTEITQQLSNCGFAVIRRFMPSACSIDAFAALGVVDQPEGLNSVHVLRPHKIDEATPNTYSGHFGINDFPLHSDLAHWAVPPKLLALRCVRGAKSVTTRLCDGKSLIASVGVEALRRTLVQPRRSLRNGKQLLRLLERHLESDEYVLRWDSLYLRPATAMSERFFIQTLRLLSSISCTEVTLLDTGDTLIIDNRRMLHGRSSVNLTASNRHIDRAYLKEVL
jgi:alpha-ketoglutarate-dependent taurine dioxygenase